MQGADFTLTGVHMILHTSNTSLKRTGSDKSVNNEDQDMLLNGYTKPKIASKTDADYSKQNEDICQNNVPKTHSKSVKGNYQTDKNLVAILLEPSPSVNTVDQNLKTRPWVQSNQNSHNKPQVNHDKSNNDFRNKMNEISRNGVYVKGKNGRETCDRSSKQRLPPLHDLRNASPLFEKDETSDSVPTTPLSHDSKEFGTVESDSQLSEIGSDRMVHKNPLLSDFCKNYSDSEVEHSLSKYDSRRIEVVSSETLKRGSGMLENFHKLPSHSVPGTPLLIRNNTNPNFDKSNYYITPSVRSSSGFNGGLRHLNSSKSLKLERTMSKPCLERPYSDNDSVFSKPSDRMSIKSLTSIGMGSTDGKKIIIRKIPTSPVELFTLMSSSTPLDEYVYEKSSQDGNSVDGESLYLKPHKRQHWSNKLQFVLACVGYTVGLGSVWRFPYLCYQSGGGVFLIPYFITMVICGIPMLYMELAIGQFTGRGPIGALDQLCPLFKGAGLASVVISFLLSTYYSVIIAYGIYYFFSSFKDAQPWVNCNNRWNTLDCWVSHKRNHSISSSIYSKMPAEEFYDYKVLQISDGIEHPQGMRWELVACLLCAWILIYFAIWKSIKSSARVRYLTTTLPFLLILVFLGKSLTLEGANLGTRYFFKPQWELLSEAKVWVNAVTQTFNSMGIAFGSMISFASYNKFNNNIVQDTLAVSFVNAITSLLVGIYSFATIGNIALEQNKSIEDVISDGPGLIFVVYPQAMGKMPASVLWASLFFFMLICLGLNSMFAIVEVVVTSIQDGFPTWIKKHLLCHEMLVLVICVVSFFCGLPNVTKGGIYFFQLMDHYAASISLIYLAFFEIIAVAWFYGVRRLSNNIKSMTGHTPSWFFRFCWLMAAPALIIAIWVSCIVDYESPTYNNGQYQYPVWARALGWTISSLSIICIPLFAIYTLIHMPGKTLIEKFRASIQPNLFECPKCGKHVCDHLDENDDEEFQPILISSNGKGEIASMGQPRHGQDHKIHETGVKEQKNGIYHNVNENIYEFIDGNKHVENNVKEKEVDSSSYNTNCTYK